MKKIKFKRITQKQETDVAFLKRLAEDYGHVFKITSCRKLVFHEIEKLEQADVVFVVNRDQILSCNIRDKTQEIYKSCEVQYHDPKEKKLITCKACEQGISKGDTLKINERVENKCQASAKAKAHLKEKNRLQTEGTITIQGMPKLVAGLNIEIKGFYTLDGKYLIESARHTISRSDGYKTELEVRKIA